MIYHESTHEHYKEGKHYPLKINKPDYEQEKYKRKSNRAHLLKLLLIELPDKSPSTIAAGLQNYFKDKNHKTYTVNKKTYLNDLKFYDDIFSERQALGYRYSTPELIADSGLSMFAILQLSQEIFEREIFLK